MVRHVIRQSKRLRWIDWQCERDRRGARGKEYHIWRHHHGVKRLRNVEGRSLYELLCELNRICYQYSERKYY